MEEGKDFYTKIFKTKRCPLVCIPTTSGTGSEVTPFAVITDDSEGEKENALKFPLCDYNMTPDMAIIDPQVISLPSSPRCCSVLFSNDLGIVCGVIFFERVILQIFEGKVDWLIFLAKKGFEFFDSFFAGGIHSAKITAWTGLIRCTVARRREHVLCHGLRIHHAHVSSGKLIPRRPRPFEFIRFEPEPKVFVLKKWTRNFDDTYLNFDCLFQSGLQITNAYSRH